MDPKLENNDYLLLKNLWGNAEGAVLDAGFPGNTYPHDAIYKLIEQRDDARTAAFREGYAMGESERVTLATVNGELRSEIREYADKNRELHLTVRRLEQMIEQRMYAPTQEYVPHHQAFFDGDHRVDL